MRIAIGRTGHEIADTIAEALIKGFGHSSNADVFIGYGILRGMDEQFKRYKHWFNVDRGYFNPGHYDGYYRISYRGTQAIWHEGIPRKPINIELYNKRKLWEKKNWESKKEYILICPPTEPVCKFFNIQGSWINNVVRQLRGRSYKIRKKGDSQPINWDAISAVITFNSSIGWQALQRGIPVISDPNHSIVGSFYKHHHLLTYNLQEMPDNHLELFEAMNAHQFTLEEIRQGNAWDLISHYLKYSSDTIAGKSPVPTSLPIPSSSAHDYSLKSIFSSIGN